MHYKQIQTHDLHSYSQELQQAVLEGYRVLTETIYFPQQIGPVLMATVGKEEEDVGILADSKPVRKAKKKGEDEQ